MNKRAPLRQSTRARGAAIIAALLVVTLAAILVAGLLWREEVQIHRVDSARLASQTQAIERGALDYARLILRSSADASPTVDYIGQVWSMPLQRTRLSDFLTQIGEVRAEQGQSTYLGGSIEDAQSRFNLRNLVTFVAGPSGPVIDPAAVASYERLLITLGLPVQLADQTALYMRSSQAAQSLATGPANGVFQASAESTSGAPLPVYSLDGLLDVPGYSPAVLARLAPFVTVLPVSSTVNVNTAPAEVIAAIIPGLTLAAAQNVVAARSKAYFRDTGDLQTLLRASGVTLPAGNSIDVRSRFFTVHENVQHERAESNRDTLIYRAGPNPNSTRIISAQNQY